MKKIIITIMLLAALLTSGCASANNPNNNLQDGISGEMTVEYLTFEEALQQSTDVVVAQYIGSKPFGKTLTELEFVVSERIFGNAPEKIYVYVGNNNVSVIEKDISDFKENEIQFQIKTNYLLSLKKITFANSKTHDDGYSLITTEVINLDKPSKSTRYGESAAKHATGIDFNKTTKNEIISYAQELSKNNKPGVVLIRSGKMEDVISGSKLVLIIQVNSIDNFVRTDYVENDIGNATVISVLKGDMKEGDVFRIPFYADSVKPGEQYIIAVEPLEEGDNSYLVFNSKNGLYSLDQENKILNLINADN